LRKCYRKIAEKGKILSKLAFLYPRVFTMPGMDQRSVTNKKNLPVYITALLTATVLLLCTVLTTLDRRRLMDENFAFEIDDDDMAAILAEPLRESSEDKETVSARNQERSTLGRQDESLSRFVLQQQRRREHAA